MKEDVIYTAGLFDGEGCITLAKSYKSGFRYPVVTISNTCESIITFCRNKYGGHVCTKQKSNPKWKIGYEWRLDRQRAIRFLILVFPYLKETEKIRRASLIINRYNKVTHPGGRYSEQMLQEKQQFETEFFHPSIP